MHCRAHRHALVCCHGQCVPGTHDPVAVLTAYTRVSSSLRGRTHVSCPVHAVQSNCAQTIVHITRLGRCHAALCSIECNTRRIWAGMPLLLATQWHATWIYLTIQSHNR